MYYMPHVYRHWHWHSWCARSAPPQLQAAGSGPAEVPQVLMYLVPRPAARGRGTVSAKQTLPQQLAAYYYYRYRRVPYSADYGHAQGQI